MKQKIIVQKEVDHIDFGYWDEKAEEWIWLDNTDEANLKDLSKRFGVPVKFLDSLGSFVEDVQEHVGDDLQSLWDRVDELEARVAKLEK